MVRPKRLDTWKAIADYLGRSCRTVQRWHTEYALPVRHLRGDSGSVFAFASDLDEWMSQQGQAVSAEAPKAEPVHLQVVPCGCGEPALMGFDREPSMLSAEKKQLSAKLVSRAFKIWEHLSLSNLSVIARHFQEAIDLDPHNAQAFAGLAQVLVVQGFFGPMPAPVAYRSALVATERALELGPELPEVKGAAAFLKLLMKKDWRGAGRDFDQILHQHAPTSRTLVGRGLAYLVEGKLPDACLHFHNASQLYALSLPAAALHCWSMYLQGDSAQALVQLGNIRSSGRHGALLNIIEAFVVIQLQGAVASIGRLEALNADTPDHRMLIASLGYAYAATGQIAKATTLLESMTRSPIPCKRQESYAVALILAGLGDNHEAFSWLELACRSASLWSLGFRFDPMLASLHSHPRYRSLLEANC